MSDTPESGSEKHRGRVADPNPERRRYLVDIIYRLATNKLSFAELKGIPKRRIRQMAELGYVKFRYGRYIESFKIFEALAAVDGTNYYHFAALGGITQKLGRFVESVAFYSKALKLNEKDLASLVNRGEIYLRHKNFKKAAGDFRNAILMDPKGKNLWANRARSLVIALKRNLEKK